MEDIKVDDESGSSEQGSSQGIHPDALNYQPISNGNGKRISTIETLPDQSVAPPVDGITTNLDMSAFDPENAEMWPSLKKIYHTSAIGFLAFSVTVGTSMVSPAIPELEREFGVSRTVASLSVTMFVLGLGLGPVLGAPISEMYGRSVVYKVTAPVYILFLVGAGLSTSIASHLICRLLAGLAGAPVLAVGSGTNVDMFPPHRRALAGAVYVMMPFFGPALGPVIGGFAVANRGWRWTQWCTIFIAALALLLVLPMQETYRKVILQRRAKKHAEKGVLVAPVNRMALAKTLITVTLIRPVSMLFTEPIVLLLSLFNAFAFGVMFAFLSAFPYTFHKVYNFSVRQSGLTFLGLGFGVVLAVVAAGIIDRTVYMKKHALAASRGEGFIAPENRLYLGMTASLGIPLGLFWFAWTARPSIHWISPVLAGVPFAFGNLAVFISAALYLIDVYGPLNGASAMAANGLVRYGMGAAFPLFTVQMYEKLGIAWATSLLGFVSLALMPIPWVFFKYGPNIRAKSRYNVVRG